MNKLLILVSYFAGLNSFSQETSSFKIPDERCFIYNGSNQGECHLLSLYLDSTYHITIIPKNSTSCWMWGGFSGKFQVLHDTLIFETPAYSNFLSGDTNSYPEGKVKYLISKNRKLIGLSEKSALAPKYQLNKTRGIEKSFPTSEFHGSWSLDSIVYRKDSNAIILMPNANCTSKTDSCISLIDFTFNKGGTFQILQNYFKSPFIEFTGNWEVRKIKSGRYSYLYLTNTGVRDYNELFDFQGVSHCFFGELEITNRKGFILYFHRK
ncbi:hypothetical protein K6119_00410 [Paracrocinitomix mangrovi]|uniref:hypothetical protein n=1 Tax=Paracrocinitomix mangrovi TaxID=2862509 RepID=UPI001C8D25EB|nr:hypothetical protein [Paracrocinitomix mangrovi]UKN01976.1 hypothetical protein K6119_00410 [Paracrocinitomix mangrovi]